MPYDLSLMRSDSHQDSDLFIGTPFSSKERLARKRAKDHHSQRGNHSPWMREGYSLQGIKALVEKSPHNTFSDAPSVTIPSNQWARSMRPRVKNGELSKSQRTQIICAQERSHYLNIHLATQDHLRKKRDRWFSLWDKSVHNHDAWGLD